MTDARVDGAAWLDAARTGGLPTAQLTRWQPLRVGIVNLWEYDEAEFWFADGRLVLRGGNGAGKTKVLELTTLMLMRGEIGASILDPFGSQHRTMRFNLLPTGEADDPRELTDTGLGYAWAEFGRIGDHGEAEYFTCGLGASARRGTGTAPVQTWQLVTRHRIGSALELTHSGRPLNETELKKLPGIQVYKSATQYRAHLARELFGMEIDAYDNLTELLKQLRKPKLGERLNPASLADTLRDALPPIAAEEIDHLADGWDRLDQLRSKVDTTKQAAHALAYYTRHVWKPWASIVVRSRADELSRTTSQLERTTDLKNRADGELAEATRQVGQVTSELERVRVDKDDREVEYLELLKSQAYADAVAAAGRVETLRSALATVAHHRGSVNERHSKSVLAVEQSQAVVTAAAAEAAAVAERQLTQARTLTELAAPVGLATATERHLPDKDIAGLRVAIDRRFERFEHHEQLHADLERAVAEAEASEGRVARYATRRDEAVSEVAERLVQLEGAVDDLRVNLRNWARNLTAVPTTDEQVEHWCDLVAELTAMGSSTSSPRAAIRQHFDGHREQLHRRIAVAEARREPLRVEKSRLEADIDRLRSISENAPPQPVTWSRRDRPDTSAGRGAPFWKCVNPRDGLAPTDLDVLEAALAAAGILDAWVTPSGSLVDADGNEPFDVQLRPRAIAGASLNEVLEPTSTDGVPVDVVAALLAGFGWFADRASAPEDGSWLSRDGCWSVGSLTGRAAPAQSASYLGIAAREAARLRAIDAAGAELHRVDEDLTLIEAELILFASQLDLLETEYAAVPSEQPVIEVARAFAVSTDLSGRAEREHATELTRHGTIQAEADDKRASLAEHAARFEFPMEGLHSYARALNHCRHAVLELSALIELNTSRQDALHSAESTAEDRGIELEEVVQELARLTTEQRQVRIQLDTAEASLQSDHHDMLDRADRLAEHLTQLGTSMTRLGDELTEARVTVASATAVLAQHEERRVAAETARNEALTAWWAVADAALLEPLGLSVPERRVVETGRESARAARRALRDVTEAAAEERAWRRCVTGLQELRQQLLPTRDMRIDDDGPVPLVLVLTDATLGWQAPQPASNALAAAVQELEERYNTEQRDVLATLLESNFIEYLKERLDYAEGTFLDINRQLALHPTGQGHVVRLERVPDPADPEAVVVVKALGHGYAQLGADRQEQVRNFLSRKIDAARADARAEGASDWKEQLASALDYRRWLRIELQFRGGDGGTWRRFDNASHGSKSGGEKVVLLSQPLFAAAVVAYNAAGRGAPRWIWLDEAMTGVDASVKESFMGLTVEFDLDIMLTAHDEWCTYRTVPAVAIYDLARDKLLPGVDVDSYLWLGKNLTQVEQALPIAVTGVE